jgi:hypothetical protein
LRAPHEADRVAIQKYWEIEVKHLYQVAICLLFAAPALAAQTISSVIVVYEENAGSGSQEMSGIRISRRRVAGQPAAK